MSFKRIVSMDIETVTLDSSNDKGALNPTAGRIVCIGLLLDDGEGTSEIAFVDEDEKSLIEAFWETVGRYDLLVGHNILDFDLMFIKQRSWILDIRPSWNINMKRFYTTEIFDTMQVWSNWAFGGNGPRRAITLNNLAQALRVGEKHGDGADVAELWERRDFEAIKRYCLTDVRLAYKIFCRLTYRQPSVIGERSEDVSVLVR